MSLLKLKQYKHMYTDSEPCPTCGDEVEATAKFPMLGCHHCGHKEVMPCSMCQHLENNTCDFNKETKCRVYRTMAYVYVSKKKRLDL